MDIRITEVFTDGPNGRIINVMTDRDGGLRMPIEPVIHQMKSSTFYTEVDGKRAEVSFANGENHRYLITHPDQTELNNLAELRK